MADNPSSLTTVGGGQPLAILSPLGGHASFGARAAAFLQQPAVRKSLPMTAGIVAIAGSALIYFALAAGPQRMLYGNLSDGERSAVVTALDQGGIRYAIDNSTGALSVGEDDLYRARMLVASNGGLAVPESTAEMLDAIPIGSSRTLEGERLRNVRERELTMTIMEIDGVEAVRVHLAQAEKSVFVRENVAPSASVMVRLAGGRKLSDDQVNAIVNLVAGSVPSLQADQVRVVDQHGQLLSDRTVKSGEGLELQRNYEDKLRAQISQLLAPLIGTGNFSTEVQVELDLQEITSARESYDKEGVIRSEMRRASTQTGAGQTGGVPGVLANTPPPATQLGPVGDAQNLGGVDATENGPTSGETSDQKTYELGREVAVSSSQPGGVKRLTVAVALSSAALTKIKPASVQQIEQLISSAVGANPDRGDRVTVIAGTFDPVMIADVPFHETAWFAAVLRNGVALIAIVLALVFIVRPIMRMIKAKAEGGSDREIDDDESHHGPSPLASLNAATVAPIGQGDLREQVDLAKKLAKEQPDRAADALRRMLASPQLAQTGDRAA